MSSTTKSQSSSKTNSLEKSQHRSLERRTPDHSHNFEQQKINEHVATTSPNNGGPMSSNYTDTALPALPPMLNEDYAELGLGDEEGDYSTPAARNYELDRNQITLAEIIGVGQFGDVHIGTCQIKHQKSSKKSRESSDSFELEEYANGNNNENKLGLIHVAVKTCKADADLITSEKFLEEACEC
jgi:hypothetical protein